MLNFVHFDFEAGPQQLAVVTLGRQANVMLLDDPGFAAYVGGGLFRCEGEWVTHSPVRLKFPRAQHWHIVVDFDGMPGEIRAEMQLVPARSRDRNVPIVRRRYIPRAKIPLPPPRLPGTRWEPRVAPWPPPTSLRWVLHRKKAPGQLSMDSDIF